MSNIKLNHRFLIVLTFAFLITTGYSQENFPITPPEVSPMKMKPEMTEIWEPEVKVITPGKVLGDPPSDAIILFDGNSLDN